MRRPRRSGRRPRGAADNGSGDGEISARVLGLDIGGSSSRAQWRDGGTVRDVEGPGANVTALAPEVVEERVTHLVSLLGEVRPDACCAGAAGAEVPTGRARLESLLRRLLPGSRVCVVHDSRLVLAAAGLDSGIAIIAGTGSVAYGRAPDGREVQVGGWGWMLGDEGGGVWITREAARLVLARMDADADRGVLGDRLVDALGVGNTRELTPALLAMHEPREWAALATVVFETANEDVRARNIIDRAGNKLARLVLQVEGALGLRAAVVLAGGLLLNQHLLQDAVRTNLPGREFVRLEQPPVVGAVRLAEDLLRT